MAPRSAVLVAAALMLSACGPNSAEQAFLDRTDVYVGQSDEAILELGYKVCEDLETQSEDDVLYYLFNDYGLQGTNNQFMMDAQATLCPNDLRDKSVDEVLDEIESEEAAEEEGEYQEHDGFEPSPEDF